MKTKNKRRSSVRSELLIEVEKVRSSARMKVRQAEDAVQAVLDHALVMDSEIQRLREALVLISKSNSYMLSQSLALSAMEDE